MANETVADIVAEAREKYTVHHCGQCELRKSCLNKFDSDECKNTRQSIMLGFGIEDGYFTKLLDRLEAAHKCEVSDALDVGALLAEVREREAFANCNCLNEIMEEANGIFEVVTNPYLEKKARRIYDLCKRMQNDADTFARTLWI